MAADLHLSKRLFSSCGPPKGEISLVLQQLTTEKHFHGTLYFPKAVLLHVNSHKTETSFSLQCIHYSAPSHRFAYKPYFLLPSGGCRVGVLPRRWRPGAGPASSSVLESHRVIKEQVFLLNSVQWNSEAVAPCPQDCAQCHISDAPSIFLFFYLPPPVAPRPRMQFFPTVSLKSPFILPLRFLPLFSFSFCGVLEEKGRGWSFQCKEDCVKMTQFA